ncbi:MAG: PIN domain-containing protein [Deltaproteobacteria bacterium]|nr:PIN domain-containing protein [Deltaproteobacteria bacterium]
MPTYFDSSVVISLIANDTYSQKAFELWHNEYNRVSSNLLVIECYTVLRRLTEMHSMQSTIFFTRLNEIIEEISLKDVDNDIIEIVKQTPELSDCHSLDTVHVATAQYFASFSDEPFYLATFDERMLKAATAVGLQTV